MTLQCLAQWRLVLCAEVVRAACWLPLRDVRVDHFSYPTRTLVNDAYPYLYPRPTPKTSTPDYTATPTVAGRVGLPLGRAYGFG